MKSSVCWLALASAYFATASFGEPPQTPFERGDGNDSSAYHEGIDFYVDLAARYDSITIAEAGTTDSGQPLHAVRFSTDGNFSVRPLGARERSVVLILNAIHPGEPDGVDASMMLLRDLAVAGGPDNVIVVVVPFYNVGGALNRNSTTRVNQQGPREYGFRGNARNLDLNRDFIKADSRNAQSFARFFYALDPDIFIDTHVSNGADYPAVLSLLATQKDKLAAPLGQFLDQQMVPALHAAMAKRGQFIVPYVNVSGRAPDSGWSAFLDMPRYSTGYAAQFQTLGFMTETHMLKPFPDRVAATRRLLESSIEYAAAEHRPIHAARIAARRATMDATRLAIGFEVRRDRWTDVPFRGYRARQLTSEVSGLPRLAYDRDKPWQGSIRFYNDYSAVSEVDKPVAYLIRAGYWPVTDRLANAGVQIEILRGGESFRAQQYHIVDYQTASSPYEGHYPHSQTSVVATDIELQARPGDSLLRMGTRMDQFLVNTLEPQASDSYFNWNFFDAILQRKEYFSSYVFEDKAAKILAADPVLAAALHKRRVSDPDFAKDAGAQLEFVYERSEHAEDGYLLYPVYRILELQQPD